MQNTVFRTLWLVQIPLKEGWKKTKTLKRVKKPCQTRYSNLVRLRHLKMFKSMFQDVHGMKLPAGIGSLKNLLSLTAIHAGGGIAEELGNLIQLRRLGVMDVAEENISELFVSITKMPALPSLSLEAKHAFNKGNLILLDSFSPPPFLQKLRLEGVLEKLPTSFGSSERLANLRLGNSHMSENS
ncbi:hypothetical protein L3X38_029143 [Prunus dulcis]|uniref:Disease resistance R13L4/SHOC-2-like LRR domain-containing protein n=1 Tax=Prunus dulcis TaxID=3755 RepID=A0AAD4VTK1_PRUDU|nr:hypothetical protein L3X38_029143 [Prunus dulcis]